MNFNKDETEYTPMTSREDNDQTITIDEPAYSYYIIPTHPKKKKAMWRDVLLFCNVNFFSVFFSNTQKTHGCFR
tara:strand:+ start:285 stop:506 length:222 start_codon:yes stop_codon:yes gene_type:complete